MLSLMNGEIVGYAPPIWVYALYGIDAAAAMILLLWGIFAWRGYFKSKKAS